MAMVELLLLLSLGVVSNDPIRHYAAHHGQRYENATLRSREPTLAACARKCLKQTPPCNAFNYRESDGSCELILSGKSGLLGADGFGSYAQRLCLTEHPNIQNAEVSYEGWDGEYPAQAGATVTLRCADPKGFSDGARLHTAGCCFASPDSWCRSFQKDGVHCEQLYKYPECRLTEKGREYIGSVNKTESGKECLRWDKKPYGTPDDFFENITYSGHFTNVDTWSHKNYCRNPSGKERPWCFVMDKDVQWEYCDIPICTDKDPPECKMTQQGGEYIGRKNVSHSGFPCQPWRSVEPQNYTQIVMAENFPGIPDYEEIDEHYNFCRNPDGDASPYCYNGKGGSPPWEHCDLSFCHLPDVKGQEGNVYPECRLSEKGKEYLGKKDVTETGKPCLHWESQPYGMPWDFYNSKIDYAEHFLNQDPTLHKNYCRNPSLYRERPWCFVLDSDIVWEYCNIPFCHHLDPPECKLTGTGGEYVGRRNTSISGSPCQHWLSQSPEPHEAIRNTLSAFSDEVDGSHNFCRNPDGSVHGPWCFIESKDGSMWEYCDVPYCPKTEGEKCDIRVSGLCVTPVECKKGRKGDKYMGTKNVTKSGHRCQLWMSRSPNDHDPSSSFYEVAGLFPDDLHPSHNFCRNPNGDVGGPWCFNGDGTNPSIDYCEVKPC